MVGGGRDWEFCFGCVEFAPLDVLVEMPGRLLDRWVCSLCLRLWASPVGNGRKKKTQFLHPYLCPGNHWGSWGSVGEQRIKQAQPPEGSSF